MRVNALSAMCELSSSVLQHRASVCRQMDAQLVTFVSQVLQCLVLEVLNVNSFTSPTCQSAARLSSLYGQIRADQVSVSHCTRGKDAYFSAMEVQ